MIKWKRNKRKLNIKDIKKVIGILPCCWADDYYKFENHKFVLAPQADGDKLIYAVSDASDGYAVMYYKCSADGTILAIGEDDNMDW